MAPLITWPSNQSLQTCVFLQAAQCIVQSETALFSASPITVTQPLAAFIDKYLSESVEYFFSMKGNEHHMHSFHNILISKSALVFCHGTASPLSFFVSFPLFSLAPSFCSSLTLSTCPPPPSMPTLRHTHATMLHPLLD